MPSFKAGLEAFHLGEYASAFQILKPIAERGNTEAQCLLGNIYHLGLGREQDLNKAIYWYQKSSDRGYGVASNNLAEILTKGGNGIIKDLDLAKKLYQKALKQGFTHVATTYIN